MRRKLEATVVYLALVACLCFATTVQAAQSAQNANSFYVGGFGGLTVMPDVSLSQAGVFSGDLETDAGYNIGGVIGYKSAVGLRGEFELSYRQNDLDNWGGFPVVGDISALTFMGNAWFDIYTATPWIPYVGGGMGVASVTLDSGGSDSDTVFAYQVGGGIGYEFVPGIVVTGDYRFLGTTDPSFEDPGSPNLEGEYFSHNFSIGIRAHF